MSTTTTGTVKFFNEAKGFGFIGFRTFQRNLWRRFQNSS